jgi:hypothetical protein
MAKTNWEQMLEQDPVLKRSHTARGYKMALKDGVFELRLEYREYGGDFRYDLRMWAYIDDEWRPTKRGLVIFPNQIEEFLDLLTKLVKGGA